jgi:hypothetical protein
MAEKRKPRALARGGCHFAGMTDGGGDNKTMFVIPANAGIYPFQQIPVFMGRA